MKTRWLVMILFGLLFVGCDHSKEEQLQQQVAELQGEQMSMEQDLSERDKYFEEVLRSVNEVYADLERTRVKEGQIKKSAGGVEVPALFSNATSRQQLLSNITEIGASLKANRKKIDELQAKAKSVRGEIAGLNKLIGNLKQSLQEREESIAQLEGKVRGLEATVTETRHTIAERETYIGEQQKQINTAYLVVGTRQELKEKGVISDEGGFLWGLLGSTTVLASGVDQSLFTPIDKTREQTVSVQGTIDEVLPHRNEDLFATAQPVENSSILTITKPEKFWQDRYLVIVVD